MQPNNAVKVLLVEDDLAEARLLQEVLKSFNLDRFQLVHVKRLYQALDYLKAAKYDVVLLDLTLPDSLGIDSLKAIIQNAPSIPIVVLTNNNDDKLALEAVREGAQDYLIKRKIDVEGLVRSIQYAIERKRAAEELRQVNKTLSEQIQQASQQLTEAKKNNQLNSEFLSMFSHEFRNPLTTILASTGLLEHKKEHLTEERQELLLKKIHAAGKSLSQLVDEIIFLGRSEAQKLTYDPESIDIKAFCQQKIEEFQLTTGSNHQLSFVSQGDFDDSLWDVSLLQHIIDNLVINAIKYSPVGSSIELKLERRLEQALLIVRDRGIGIPDAYLKKLFTPFQRAENVEHIPGTGLGLVIVKKCIEVQQGKINIVSQKNKGTIVTVTLPLVK